jgi:hypothetical protein
VTTGVRLAEHPAVVPPLLPVHAHVQGPEPETGDAVPEEQSPVVGAVDTGVVFEIPQVPEIAIGVGDPPPVDPPPVEGGVTGIGVVTGGVVGIVLVQLSFLIAARVAIPMLPVTEIPVFFW